jgi:hypothetical protein
LKTKFLFGITAVFVIASSYALAADKVVVIPLGTTSDNSDASYGSSANSPNDAVFVDDEGNVGLGTTNPGSPFHIVYKAGYGDNELANFSLLSDGANFGNAYLTILGQRRGISQTNTAYINFDNYDADETPSQYTMARISGGNPSDSGRVGHLILYTNPGASLTERMRILSNGNVGIGTDSPESKLSVVGLPSGTTDSVTEGSLAGALCITDTGNIYIDTDGSCAN